MEKIAHAEGGFIVKEYISPAISGGNDSIGRVPPAVLFTAAAAGLLAGVTAGFVVSGVKKVFGDIVATDIPALEPCID